ncbi:MAG: DUF401 family protein [Chloroflexi bacterium]|nr:DUF401 family protein [Chloroflexota bacterium]
MIETFKVILIFALMIALLRKKLNLGIVMITSAIFLGLLFQLPPLEIGRVSVLAAIQPTTLNLVLVFVLIMVLENVMRKTLILQRMITSLGGLVRDHRLVVVALPAFIGLLPSAGGAIFSAPMVEQASLAIDLSPERKSFINYWYRHLWEYVSPIYPALILGSQILNIPIRNMILAQIPFTVLAALVAAPFSFAGVRHHVKDPVDHEASKHWRDLAIGLSPIVAVLIMVILLRVDVTIALAIAVISLLGLNRYSPRRVIDTVRESLSINVVFVVIGIMVFKDVLVASGAVDSLPKFFESLGVPVEAMVSVLAFLVGFLTGFSQAPVATSFPMILGLSHAGNMTMPLVALTFVAGFAGVMLSPIHLCFILTNQFFKADVARVYRLMIVPQLTVLAAAVGIYFLMLR